MVVEIGDAQILKSKQRKHKTPVRKDQYWVFGGIERRSGKCFVVDIREEMSENMNFENCVKKYIRAGTIICSASSSSSCSSIKDIKDANDQLMYKHQNSEAPSITQLFAEVRENVIKQGVNRSNFSAHLCRYMFMRKHKNDSFPQLLQQSGKSYPFSQSITEPQC